MENSEFRFEIAQYLWQIEHKLEGDLIPLASRLSYYYRSSEIPIYEAWEEEMISFMQKVNISVGRKYARGAVLREIHQWLSENEQDRTEAS